MMDDVSNKQKIFNAAIALYASRGVDVPVIEIARAAQVSNGTIFHQFTHKQGLIDALYIYVKTNMAQTMSHDFSGGDIQGLPTEKAVDQLFQAALNWALAQPQMYAVASLLKASHLAQNAAIRSGDLMFKELQVFFASAQQKGDVRLLPAQYIVDLFFAHIDITVHYVNKQSSRDPFYQNSDGFKVFTSNASALFWRGIS